MYHGIYMRVGIIGASGFLGNAISAGLNREGFTVIPFSRSQKEGWRVWNESPDLSGLDAIINLAGQPIDTRWSDDYKKVLVSSRVDQTQQLVNALEKMKPENRPSTLINTSGVALYGSHESHIFDESSAAVPSFLGDLCLDWEAEAKKAEALGIRVVFPRLGLVFGKEGSAWKRMLSVFKLGLGGPLGSGQQWMPWVHLEDVVGLYIHAIKTSEVQGPMNAVAPEPCRNITLTKALGQLLKRPTVLPAPTWALRIVLGEFAEVVLGSQNIAPKKATESGYAFKYPAIKEALADLI